MINPLGFTLEHFDALGRYRKEEKGKPIDATGSYETRSGETVKFSGVPRSGGVSCHERRSPLGFCAAIVPLPDQAADRRIWSSGAARATAFLRSPRFQHPKAHGRDYGLDGFDAPRGEAVESVSNGPCQLSGRVPYLPASLIDYPA